MNSSLELRASRNRDGGSHQYRTFIRPHTRTRAAQLSGNGVRRLKLFPVACEPHLSHGHDVSAIFSRLHQGQICTLGNPMLTDEQAAGLMVVIVRLSHSSIAIAPQTKGS